MDFVHKGVNGSIICFGPTGSGKTFCLKGNQPKDDRGMAPRAVDDILTILKAKTLNNVSLDLEKTSFFSEDKKLLRVQIYMITSTRIVDLLEKQVTMPCLQHYLDH